MTRLAVAVAVIPLCCAVAPGAVFVAPDVPETSFSGISTPIRRIPRVYQQYIDPGQLAAVTEPVFITAMQWRLSAVSPGVVGDWPSRSVRFDRFDVQLSQADAQVAAARQFLGGNRPFADNTAGDVTAVHTGPWTIESGAFPNPDGVSPRPFGAVLTFSQPYRYDPGETLVITLRHSGFGAGNDEPQPLFASFTPPDFNYFGVADAVASLAGGVDAAAPDTFNEPSILQFTFAPVPEPGAALLALGALGVSRAARRRGAEPAARR